MINMQLFNRTVIKFLRARADKCKNFMFNPFFINDFYFLRLLIINTNLQGLFANNSNWYQ